MKKLLSFLIISVMLLSLIPMTAGALVVDDWEIEISNGNAYIIGFNGSCSNKMTLPTQIGNFPVVGLKSNIFTENVTEIIIPEGYTNISIPNSHGKNLFNLRDTLAKITLPSTLVEFNVSFKEFSKLTEINIPGGVKAIPESQFEGCINLKKVVLNDGLEKIGKCAFYKCHNLSEIKIPNTVKEIYGWAFRECHSLKNIVIPNSVEVLGKTSAAIIYCNNLETVVLSDNITKLYSAGAGSWGELANCPKLKSVYIGNNVLELENSPDAYEGIMGGNESLKTIIIPEGVITIGSCAFKNNNNLEAVVLPKSFSKIQLNLKGSKPFYQFDGWDAKQPLPKLYLYGYKGTYAETFANEGGFPFVDISVATPTDSKVVINGKEVAFTAYNIGGNNYFKLRDIAAAINGTNKNFSVGWDGDNNAISLNSKSAYTNVGGELVVNSNATATEPEISNPKIFVDGKLTTFMAFSIADNNYIKLRDLGEVFDFGVDWNDATQTIAINTNKGYTK